jgi:hypothetical protein
MLSGHVILGQILKYHKIYFGPIWIDPRVSLFLVQPSGTGKSTPWEFISKVAQAGGLNVSDMDDISDAALIGGIEDVEELDPETRTKVTIHKEVSGLLQECDLLHYDEGKMIVERPSYAANILTWLQKALNPIDSEQNVCVRRLKYGTIRVKPTCSLIITSHPIEELLNTVLDTGFFQRIVLYCRDISISQRQSLEFMRVDRLGVKSEKAPLDIKGLGEKINQIRAHYKDKDVVFSENVKPILKGNIKKLYDEIAPTHERVKEIMATFVPRYANIMYVLAYHHACDRLSDEVQAEDVKYAYALTYILFKELKCWVETTADFHKIGRKDSVYLNSALSLYNGISKDTPDGYVMKYNFMKLCQDRWRISIDSVNKYLALFRGYGKLKEREENNVIYIKIIP